MRIRDITKAIPKRNDSDPWINSIRLISDANELMRKPKMALDHVTQCINVGMIEVTPVALEWLPFPANDFKHCSVP